MFKEETVNSTIAFRLSFSPPTKIVGVVKLANLLQRNISW
jgi:hypothetical protein